MPKSKYDSIYRDLKKKIEADTFSYQELLPPENTLIQQYDCSRNTVRRAIGKLVTDGYVQTIQGKGVRNIYRPVDQTAFTIREKLRLFGNLPRATGRFPRTKVVLFTEVAGERRSRQTERFSGRL